MLSDQPRPVLTGPVERQPPWSTEWNRTSFPVQRAHLVSRPGPGSAKPRRASTEPGNRRIIAHRRNPPEWYWDVQPLIGVCNCHVPGTHAPRCLSNNRRYALYQSGRVAARPRDLTAVAVAIRRSFMTPSLKTNEDYPRICHWRRYRSGCWARSRGGFTARRPVACRHTCSAAGLVSTTTCCRTGSEAGSPATGGNTVGARRPTTTFCAPHACRPLWRDRVNTLRAATRSCTRRRITRQPTPARETRMRIVKPCRPSAATDPHLGAPRAITGDERREERRQVRIMDPAKVICALSSVAWDNRLIATATVLECRNRSMPRDQHQLYCRAQVAPRTSDRQARGVGGNLNRRERAICHG